MKRKYVAPVFTAADLPAPIEELAAFVKAAILAGRGEYKGLHVVYGNLNAALKKVWAGCNPVAVTTALVEKGYFVAIPRKGGPVLYLPEDAPKAGTDKGANDLLAKMGMSGKVGGTQVTL